MENSASKSNANKPSHGWRVLGFSLVLVALFVTCTGLFFVEEDWRGKSDWQAYKRDAAARGVELDIAKFVPPTVPDEQNFAMTPFLAPLLNLRPRPFNGTPYADKAAFDRAEEFGDAFLRAVDDQSKMLAAATNSNAFDPVAYAMALQKQLKLPPTITPASTPAEASAAILSAMEQLKPVLDEIRKASQRRYARFNVHYEDEDPAGILLPHLAVVKKLAQIFGLRAWAELAAGRTNSAFDDVQMMFYLSDTASDEPFIISHLVRLAIFKLAEQVIIEGLETHAWSDEQLGEFESRLEKAGLLKELKQAFAAERAAFGGKLFELMEAHPSFIQNITEDITLDEAALRFVPTGWIFLEQINYNRFFDDKIFPAFDADCTRIYPQISEAASLAPINKPPDRATPFGSEMEAGNGPALRRLFRHTTLEHMLASALSPLIMKSAQAQTRLDQTAVACAIERFRLANGKLPDDLESLVPKFLSRVPIDVCSGNPLIYRVEGGTRFTLYSVGWNETDDGGVIAFDETVKPARINPKLGDWVWPAD